MVIREQLLSAVDGLHGVAAADRLCEACVSAFDVDAAAISLVFDGVNTGTLGCSDAAARRYDEMQFSLGEGPCLDAVTEQMHILVNDLADLEERRWPMYALAMVDLFVRGVFALPVAVGGESVGALDLFRARPGPLSRDDHAGAVVAAEIAGAALLDLLDSDLAAAVANPDSSAWADLHAVSRADVSQATGMLVAQLGIEPAAALARLRAHAYSSGRSGSEVARDILGGQLTLEP
ncbi:GAF domain-containing protein [Mycolicibacterium flavescens]|uniref:Antitermination regulator n=1 Tax=Mycolicibacterium flavescens TaxID=1776 RepID=A0A1E3RN53_MYCFV|nr:GAF domain-containing protein [Mycolicibacterium flavescens]MCV7281757.1 GAF domain-containing protein [Mycolicibacterium flavescens]ODQ90852.1 antitermination regulator [Mycolicibacterium flavescens]